MLRLLLATLALISLSAPASADIYKCRLPGGKTEISNTPCPSGSGTVVARPDEAVSEESRRQAEKDVERMRNYVEKREAIQRADEAAEREERLAGQRPQNSPARAPRQTGNVDECLRDLAQITLEASQRARMESDCRSMAAPQNVFVPVPVPVPYQPMHRPHRVYQEPAPKPPPPPQGPKITFPLPKK